MNASYDAETRLELAERTDPLPGDDIVRDASVQITRGITIAAPPAAIWPCLLELVGGELAGGAPSYRDARYAVLACEAPRALVLGGLYDCQAKRYLPFGAARPAEFWHATWALVLEPIGGESTRLHVRSRVAATEGAMRWSAVWLHPFHDFMDSAELGQLKARAESRSAAPRPSVVRRLLGRVGLAHALGR